MDKKEILSKFSADPERYYKVKLFDDEKFEPSGALFKAGLYGSANTNPDAETKFCSECGQKISASAKFCTDCGADQ